MKKNIVTILMCGILIIGCSAMGTDSSEKKIEKFVDSKNYDPVKKQFKNRLPDLIDKMMDRNFSFKGIWTFFTGVENDKPKERLPEVKPNLDDFLALSEDVKVIWFGHSTFLLNMEGKIVLVDPVFSKAASPVSLFVNRFQEPVLSLEELPEIDYILISHDHYDHLDMESIKFFKDKKNKFITPLGVGTHIAGWGIDESRIIERDWWQSIDFDGVKFIATPAQHFSGRGLFDRNKTLWASWVIQSENNNIYFSGDSGYDTHFKDIGDKYGPFDMAFIESGQYNEKWQEVHLIPIEGIQAYKDLKAKKYFPVHWGMFVLALHTWYDPIMQLTELAGPNQVNLVSPKIGEMINVKEDKLLDIWWKKIAMN